MTGCTAIVGDDLDTPPSPPPLDVFDSAVNLATPADAPNKRRDLVEYLWGPAGMPANALPASVERGVPSPLQESMPNLARVDHFVFDLGHGIKNEAFHFIPQNPKGRLVIVQQGHAATLDSGYLGNTIAELVEHGYSALGAMMPCFNYSYPCPPTPSNLDGSNPHGGVMNDIVLADGTGHPLRLFLDHLVESLNYLRTRSVADEFPAYDEFAMTGLSGGGWTTMVYSALDPTIRLSVPVSGGTPFSHRKCSYPAPECIDGYEGDAEQVVQPFYRIAGYMDLFAMASAEPGRRQVQVQIRNDACCFGVYDYSLYSPIPNVPWDQAVRSDEQTIQGFLSQSPGAGWYRYEIDETSAGLHVISPGTRAQVLFAELDGERRPMAARSASAIYARGSAGMLWRGPSWASLDQTVVGTPSAIADDELVLRDATSNIVHISMQGGGLKRDVWPGTIAGNPAAQRLGTDDVAVVAVGADARLWLWRATAGDVALSSIDSATEVAGTPVLLSTGASQLDAFVRRTDDALQHLYLRAGGWTSEAIAGTFHGEPTALISDDGVLRVLARGADDRLWEARQKAAGGDWLLRSLTDDGGLPSIEGSPSALVDPATQQAFVVARTASGASRWVLDEDDDVWSVEAVPAPNGSPPLGTTALTFSPDAVSGGLLLRGDDGSVWFDAAKGGWSYEAGLVH
jgi:hypothetical protein